MTDMTEGARLIAEERARQVDEEGWSAEHDDFEYGGSNTGMLAKAGAAYALASYGSHLAYDLWPWDARWWKPGPVGEMGTASEGDIDGRIRTLTKAGALIAAEIDRLGRAR